MPLQSLTSESRANSTAVYFGCRLHVLKLAFMYRVMKVARLLLMNYKDDQSISSQHAFHLELGKEMEHLQGVKAAYCMHAPGAGKEKGRGDLLCPSSQPSLCGQLCTHV